LDSSSEPVSPPNSICLLAIRPKVAKLYLYTLTTMTIGQSPPPLQPYEWTTQTETSAWMLSLVDDDENFMPQAERLLRSFEASKRIVSLLALSLGGHHSAAPLRAERAGQIRGKPPARHEKAAAGLRSATASKNAGVIRNPSASLAVCSE
jgi:hypothetical protein